MKTLIIEKQKNKNIPVETSPNLYKLTKAFDFYNKELKPLVAKVYQQPHDGMHGLDTHTSSVVFRGIDYALHMGHEPIPVVFACAFHDMARSNDGFDTEHGKHAIPNAIKIMKKFPWLLDQDTRLSILYAILNHTTGRHAPDYISACTWDADRTRLAWKYGFDESFFNTERGKYVAQHYKKYLEYQKYNFPRFEWSKQY